MLKHQKTIILLIVCILGLGYNQSFAAGPNNCLEGDFWEQTMALMDLFLNILSWLWIPFATIAGKLMSNSMVYGEFINIDKVLYMLWNISRTFANFLAAGLILYNIIIGLTSGKEQNDIIMKVLKVAGGIILANMSWFITGAVVDISTIITTTVAALPGTYFSVDTVSKNTIISAINKNTLQRQMTFNLDAKFCNGDKIITFSSLPNHGSNQTLSNEELLDSVMPQRDSISGPLLYLGSSVLKIQDLIITNNLTNSGIDNVMIICIRLGMTVLFFIAIVMLLIINIFRILYLWFFIAFAPLLVLLYVSNDEEQKIPGLDNFSMGNIIKLIFAPVIITGLLSVAMIMIVLMQQVLQANNSYVKFSNGLLIQNTKNNSTIASEGIFETNIQGSLIYDSMKNSLANTFSDLIISGLTLSILWGIIKAIQKYNEGGMGGSVIDGIANASGSLLGSIPIIPVGGGERVGLKAAKKAGLSMINKVSNEFGGNTQGQLLENKINGILGLPTHLLDKQIAPLINYAKKIQSSQYGIGSKDIDEFFTKYNEVGILSHYTKEKKPISISGMSGIKDTFPILLQKIYDNRNESSIQKKYGTTISQLSEFKEGQNISEYIDKNYKSNKILFDNLYQNITGQTPNLSSLSPGKDFREKNIIPQQ